ncbi:MAG: hypothetical protein ACKVWV_00995 [Planctomycetota bacterium]
MDELTDFEIVERRGYLRPRSPRSIDHAASMVDAALAFARARGLREVVADVTALAGFPSPTVVDRFWIVSRWALTAEGCVRLAVVACPEHIDPQRFGVTVARNRGLEGNVFVAEAEAVAWLDGLSNVAKSESPGAGGG